MVKVISLSNEAYKRLKERKKNSSFSQTVLELLEGKKKKDILDFFGAWPGDKKELDKIEKIIYEERKKATFKEVKF